jgi:hypothetical protein
MVALVIYWNFQRNRTCLAASTYTYFIVAGLMKCGSTARHIGVVYSKGKSYTLSMTKLAHKTFELLKDFGLQSQIIHSSIAMSHAAGPDYFCSAN